MLNQQLNKPLRFKITNLVKSDSFESINIKITYRRLDTKIFRSANRYTE